MRSAAVIGARSMLGAQLIAGLRARDIEIVTIGRSAEDDILFDLRDGEFSAQAGLSVDIVFHCAASFAGDDDDGFRRNFQDNAASAIAVADIAKTLAARALIYAGSLSSDRTLDDGNVTAYGLTKAIAEQIFEWSLPKRDMRFCSLRFAQLYDTQGHCCAHQPWFGRIVAYTSRGKDIHMPRSEGVRNFMHVQDAADLMIHAGNGTARGVMNASHPNSLTMEQIAAIGYDVFARGGKAVIVPEKQPFRSIRFPDGQATFATIGHWPAITVEDGMRMIRDHGMADAFGPMDIT